ncbi:MAG TPA: hypothetical protein VFZ84_08585 [Burkholderiales bacterium]
MRHRTAVKTGRTAAMQADGLAPRAFSNYVAMVDRLSAGYFRPMRRRQPSPKRLS